MLYLLKEYVAKPVAFVAMGHTAGSVCLKWWKSGRKIY